MLQVTQPAPLRILPPRFAITPYLLTNNKATSLARKRNRESHLTLTIALVLLPRRELAGSPRKGGSQGKTCLQKHCPGTYKAVPRLVSPAAPGHWLSDLIARTPRAESFSVDAELSTGDVTSAQILLKSRGLSSLPLAETD